MLPLPSSSAGEFYLLILLCLPLNLMSFRKPSTHAGPLLCVSTAPCLPLSLDLSHCNEMDLILPWHLFGSDSPTSPTLQWVQKGLGPFLLHLCIPRCLELSGHIILVNMCWLTKRTNPNQWPSYNGSYRTLLQCYEVNRLSKDSVLVSPVAAVCPQIVRNSPISLMVVKTYWFLAPPSQELARI